MWTKETRRRHDRSGLRNESDLTDDEWAEVGSLISPAKPGGNKRTVDLREILNGVMYVLSAGCQWRAIPKDLPPWSTLYDYFVRWEWDGTMDRMHHTLYIKCREQAAREASPTAAIIDSQSVKSAEKGGGRGVTPNRYFRNSPPAPAGHHFGGKMVARSSPPSWPGQGPAMTVGGAGARHPTAIFATGFRYGIPFTMRPMSHALV